MVVPAGSSLLDGLRPMEPDLGFREKLLYSPFFVDRIRFWVYSNKIPIYPISYLLKGDYNRLGGELLEV